MRSTPALACVVLLAAMTLSGPPAGAAPAGPTAGVVDFYAPTPLGLFSITPERYAADHLSALLAGGSAPFIVIPRRTMAQAQAALRWQESDALHFDRLRALAATVGADRLVVGWIPLLVINNAGGFFPGSGSAGPASADVNLVIQVFDAAQGRLIAERRFAASTLGPPTRDLLAREVLDQALRSAAPAVADLVAAPASTGVP